MSDLPQVDYPTIQVQAQLPGASPETMASSVATVLERQFTTIAGLDSMISQSNMGGSNITLQFNLSRDIDGAAVDVETAIAAAMPLLPAGMPTPPSFNKQNPADEPIIQLAMTSPTMLLSDLDEYAETMIAHADFDGSWRGARSISGAPPSTPCACRWTRTLLATRQIGLNEISDAINNWNVNLPTGTLFGPHTAYNVLANGQLTPCRRIWSDDRRLP